MNTDIGTKTLSVESRVKLTALLALFAQYLDEISFDLKQSATLEIDGYIDEFLTEQNTVLYLWFGRK